MRFLCMMIKNTISPWLRMSFIFLSIITVCVGQVSIISAGSSIQKTKTPTDEAMYEALIPLHEYKLPPGPYDWMAQHREPAQTYYDYTQSAVRKPDPTREKLYIVMIGSFNDEATRIMHQTAEWLEIYYGLPVHFLDPISTDIIPEFAQRVHPQTNDHQLLTTHIIEDVLIPRKPEDAYGLIAFTSDDLWPGEGWNFVFGQASLEDQVGVWSMHRNGNPSKDAEAYQLCLLRTLKTGSHEVGHMFGMTHCPFFECGMNGSNHRQESDLRPLWLCPVCLHKLQWLTEFVPTNRYHQLESYSRKLGLMEETQFFRQSRELIIAIP